MKKILSLILACVFCVTAMSVMVFADTETSDNLFGIITDADGNVVEVLPMPRGTYVDSIYTIPAGGSFISYQYEPKESFVFGFYCVDKNFVRITELNRVLELSLEMSNSIGGGNRYVWGPYRYVTTSDVTGGFIGPDDVSIYDYKYYNGKLVNKSSLSTTVRIIVAMDPAIVPTNMLLCHLS